MCIAIDGYLSRILHQPKLYYKKKNVNMKDMDSELRGYFFVLFCLVIKTFFFVLLGSFNIFICSVYLLAHYCIVYSFWVMCNV